MGSTLATVAVVELPPCHFEEAELRHASLALQRRVDEWLCSAAIGWQEATADAASIVRERSAALIRGIPPGRVDALLSLAVRLGGATAEGNGSPNRLVADVAPEPNGKLHSTSRAPFPLHTDSTGREHPHAFVLLAAVALNPPPSGTLVADAQMLKELLAGHPKLKAQLERNAYRFGQLSGLPVLDRNGGIRFREDMTDGLDGEAVDAVQALATALRDIEPQCLVDLRPGDVLLVDNRRALHGRVAIPAEQRRQLLRLKVPARSHDGASSLALEANQSNAPSCRSRHRGRTRDAV